MKQNHDKDQMAEIALHVNGERNYHRVFNLSFNVMWPEYQEYICLKIIELKIA